MMKCHDEDHGSQIRGSGANSKAIAAIGHRLFKNDDLATTGRPLIGKANVIGSRRQEVEI